MSRPNIILTSTSTITTTHLGDREYELGRYGNEDEATATAINWNDCGTSTDARSPNFMNDQART